MPEIPPQPFRRVLVTGAAGFIGSHLVDRLLAGGAEVTGVDCFDDYYDPALKRANLDGAVEHDRFRLVEADVRDAAAMGSLLEPEPGFDVVVHLAARAGVRPSLARPALYFDVNVRGTLVLLEALRSRPRTRFVLASSSSVYGGLTRTPFRETDEVSRPVSPYAASKKAAEVLAYTFHHLHGIPVSVLRFFTVYGPRQRPEMAIAFFTSLLEEGRPLPTFGDGRSARDYTYVDDIIAGVVRAMERTRGYEIYNLGESATTTLAELVELLGRVTGTLPEVEQRDDQPGDVRITCADVTKARELLGYRPGTTVEEGLRRYVEWRHARQASTS